MLVDDFSHIQVSEEEQEIFSLSQLSSKLKQKDFELKDPIFTYYDQLDQITGGFYPGELIVLSANTKQGKTTFAQSVTLNLAEHNQSVLWFTLEMSWQELTRKFMKMSGSNVELPIFYPIDNSKLCVTWIEELTQKAIKEKDVKLIVIDHLHFLLPLRDFHTSISFLVGGIVRDIKKVAVNLGIPIILIAHPGISRDEEEISWKNIRDSSFITQESDFTIVMSRIYEKVAKEKIATNRAKISVELNRRTGNVGKIELLHTNGRFHNLIDVAKVPQSGTEEKIINAEDIEF